MLGSDDQAAALDGTLVTSCNDMKTRLSPEQVKTAATDWQKQFPLFGPLVAAAARVLRPVDRADHPLPTPTGRGAPPILVLGTASDAITPLEGTERAAQQLDSGVLVVLAGRRARRAGLLPVRHRRRRSRFLTDAAVPRNGTVCPP